MNEEKEGGREYRQKAILFKNRDKLGMVAHACNPIAPAEAGESQI